MAEHYTGGCACGAVTLEIGAAPVAVRQCWCRHCQQLCGGGPAHNAFFPTEAVRIEGPLGVGSYTADSGTEICWEFCKVCGSPLLAYAPIRAHLRGVRLGAIDRPHDLMPQMAIWLDEAPEWAQIDPAIPHFPRQPPPPPAK